MPTYVYGCDSCGQQFEKFQKFSDEPVRVCPNCGNPVRRVFQPAGIVFKGSGWHVTDYKRNGGGNGSSGDTKDSDTKSGDAATKDSTKTGAAASGDSAAKPAATSGNDTTSSAA